MATNLGQSVLKCKDKSALDAEIPLGHTVQMADSDQEDHYKQEFIARTRDARIATGKKQWQVAELLGINVGTVKSRIARARANLRALIAKACPEFDDDAEPADWFEANR